MNSAYSCFSSAYSSLCKRMAVAMEVPNIRWQGMDVSKSPAAKMYELPDVDFSTWLDTSILSIYQDDIQPNLPWADDHFLERVGGHPLNPGKEWANWPWANSADKARDQFGRFNHTYAERLWPKFARLTEGGILDEDRVEPYYAHRGASGQRYGDLEDLIELLVEDPYTRQAWIPLFFPEDTGIGDGGRKPCTLGYQFIVRNGRMNIWYPLRSCDLIHHFRDDCYLAVRLLLWVLEGCKIRTRESRDHGRQTFWENISPGKYSMHMTSLHCFENDHRKLREENRS